MDLQTPGKKVENIVVEDNEKLCDEYDEQHKFSLATDELDRSFCSNFKAVTVKKLQIYKRNKGRVFCEVLLPSAFMIFGIWLASLDWQYRSESWLLEPSLYPLKQKLMINQNTYDAATGNVEPKVLAENLPDFANAFDVSYSEVAQGSTFDTYADALFAFGTREAREEPYLYGSYEIYQADSESHLYKFVSYINMTSSASSILYPQFMYESILKTATGDSEFEFKTRSTPYPVNKEL